MSEEENKERAEEQTDEVTSHYPYSGRQFVSEVTVLVHTDMQKDFFSLLNNVSFLNADIFLPFEE